jgi:hypothetical protein
MNLDIIAIYIHTIMITYRHFNFNTAAHTAEARTQTAAERAAHSSTTAAHTAVA